MSPTGRDHTFLVLPLAALLAILVLGVYYAIVARPLWGAVITLGHDVHTKGLQRRHLEQLIATTPHLRQEYHQLAETVQAARTTLPSEDDVSSVVQQLSNLASETGVKIQTIFPQPLLDRSPESAGSKSAASAPLLYTERLIQIEALAGFHQLGDFVSRVESATHPMQVRRLKVTGNPTMPRRHTVKMTVVAYLGTQAPQAALAPPAPQRSGGS